ncbi:CoA transferase [Nocardioides sp. GY 10127]|nr:CoA transferase [Nocardioides sp. GY 10127]
MPLDGILVADFSRVLAGPLAAATLADLGADVVKVERPGSGDDTRGWGPPWGPTTSTYFASANRSKRSVTLDLADEHDLALARELAARCDVLLENFRPGTLDRLGLGHEQVRATNPGVVYASISGFGVAGGAGLPGYDFLVQAMGGLMSITGPAGDPHKVGVALVDVLCSKDVVTGVLAALRHRDRTGEGQLVRADLLSSLLGSLVNQASAYLGTGDAPRALGNAHPSIAPYELLRAGDGALAVCAGNDGQFQRLCAALGVPGLATDARFATNRDRVAHRDALAPLLEDALAAGTVEHWTAALAAVGVPAGPVASVPEAFALAEGLGLAPTVEVGDGEAPQVRHPVTYSATPVARYTRPPRLGEHDDDIRAWLTREA